MSHDTKLQSDVAECAATAALVKRGFKVLRPVGDRLPYDLALDVKGRLIRLQVKSAWYEASKDLYTVDVRRTKTNRRFMRRARYTIEDFDFALLYVSETDVFYIMPVAVFISYQSGISLVEQHKRQREPRSAEFRERWDLLEGELRDGNLRFQIVTSNRKSTDAASDFMPSAGRSSLY